MDQGLARIAIKNLRGIVYRINFVLAGCALSLFAWNLASYLKGVLVEQYPLRLHPWTSNFYHPHDAAFLNYVLLLVVMGLYGALLYFKRGSLLRYLLMKRRTPAGSFPALSILSSPLFFVLLNRHWEPSSRLLISLYLLFILFVPLGTPVLARLRKSPLRVSRLRLGRPFSWKRVREPRYVSRLLLLLSVVVWCLLALEPARLIRGPVYVMNEFRDLYSETRIDGEYVPNRDFLELRDVNGARTSAFAKANLLEYVHQNNTRGQLHHIGHILNPLNEYVGGKALPDVYMQYGWGNTLLYKVTMELFGGLSVENFYKCYIYYILYGLLFAAMLLVVFRDSLFVFCGSLFYAACFYSCSYLIFIIAPGIVPTIHFFDASVLLLLTLYFRRSNPVPLLAALLLSGAGLYLNRQFGLVLYLSAGAASLLYLWENKRWKERLLLSPVVLFLPFALLLAPGSKSAVNSGSTLVYFLNGFLSYRPEPDLVFFTVLYLVAGFYFLFLLRKKSHHLKYAFVFAFIYSLGMLTYFFWSGLTNHLAPVLPFAGVALLLMLRLGKEFLPAGGKPALRLSIGLVLVALALSASYGSSLKKFYRGKKVYDANFRKHAVHEWDLERARIVTTMDPKPWRESISLIHKYSPVENSGIYLLSTYDKFLPFLAKRHSLMPFFEMQWYLFSAKESAEAVRRIESGRPEYLFVGRDLAQADDDPWDIYYDDTSVKRERRSNRERRLELARVFAAVEKGYEKVEEGPLVTVYRRRAVAEAPAGTATAR